MRLRMMALVLAISANAFGAGEHYDAHGKVASFGKERKYVNIAHDDIPGYMMAMTMSFDPRSAQQLDGIKEGDRVKFAFTVDGQKRWIDSISKE